MGWFGFNGGSVLKLGDIANANSVAVVFLNTNAAASGGLIAALIVARIMFGKADLTMALNGALAGLVAITAEPASPSPLLATVIGAIGGIIVVFSIVGLDKLKIDDVVGAIHHVLMNTSLEGPVNAVAPQAVTNRQFTATLAALLGRPAFLPVPATGLRLLVGEFATALLASAWAMSSLALRRAPATSPRTKWSEYSPHMATDRPSLSPICSLSRRARA